MLPSVGTEGCDHTASRDGDVRGEDGDVRGENGDVRGEKVVLGKWI